MRRFNTFEFQSNFWSIFPETKAIERFKELHDNDETENKTQSSSIMWALHLCLNPKSLVFNNSRKWEYVNKTIIKDENFKWDDRLIAEYQDTILNPAEKYFAEYGVFLEKQKQFLNNFDYSTATDSQIKTVEAMIGNSFKKSQEYDRIKKLLVQEDLKVDDKPSSFFDKK